MTLARLIGLSLLVTLAAGCQPAIEPVCESPCGVVFDGPGISDCADVDAAEVRALVGLAEYGLVCSKLDGWHVHVVETSRFPFSYPDGGVSQIGGVAYCDRRHITLGSAADGLSKTSYAHELMHVAECFAGRGDSKHASWGVQFEPGSKWLAVERSR